MEPETVAAAPMPRLQELLPNPESPWLVSPGVFQRIQSTNNTDGYKKCEITSNDPEWAFLLRYFTWQKPNNRCIKKAYCIHSPEATQAFQATIPTLDKEAKNPAFSPRWPKEGDAPLRQKVHDRWKEMVAPYSPVNIDGTSRKEGYTNVKVLPLWHGTKAAICNSICQTGFAFFGKHNAMKGDLAGSTDLGYFGSGIYFTNSARYAAEAYSDGNLFLAWVSMREPYPVVADSICRYPSKPKDMKKLEGLGAYENYNCHHIPVISINPANPSCKVYYPCAPGQEPMCDEIVVFQQSQTLARFWLELEIELPKNPADAKITIGAFLQKVLDLLEMQAIQQDPNLTNILEEKAGFLIVLNPNQILPTQEEEFCRWAMQLLDQTGKIRTFVSKKLLTIQTPPVSTQQQIDNPETVKLKTLIQKINNKEITFESLQLYTIDQIMDFFGHLSQELIRLDLNNKVTKEDLKKIKLFPKLKHLCITGKLLKDGDFVHFQGMTLTSVKFGRCEKLTDSALAHLKGMPLTSVEFSGCKQLTDNALVHLKGMPLTSVNFCWSKQLTDSALSHLKGMSLTSVDFRGCSQLTDNALAHLKGMPLTSVNFSWCKQLTDNALAHLKGMSLTTVDFDWCVQLTDNAFAHLKGMPLTSVYFSWCEQLTDNALAHLKGMPLNSVKFSYCNQLTDNALAHLKGLPLTIVDFSLCRQLTDNGLAHLKGMSLTSVNFGWCKQLTDNALAHLKGMPLTSVYFSKCEQLTDNALAHLKGMPLTSVDFGKCDQLTDNGLAHLKGMPLTSVHFGECNQLTDNGLAHLKGMSLTNVHFNWCEKLTDNGLAHLKGMPLTIVDFGGCRITDNALANLKGMPLKSVDFSECKHLTDNGLAHLKGMPLINVKFRSCEKLTDNGLAYLKGMPLMYVDFNNCSQLTKAAVDELKAIKALNF